jgi:hypothetical protein
VAALSDPHQFIELGSDGVELLRVIPLAAHDLLDDLEMRVQKRHHDVVLRPPQDGGEHHQRQAEAFDRLEG